MLRVTVLELAATWGEAAVMLAEVSTTLARGPETDLVLLPEASLTGYVSPSGDFDLAPFAESIDGDTAHAIAAVAKRHAVTLVAPLALAERGEIFNAMVAFDARGELLFTYRKRHPWFPETWATPGVEPPPVLVAAGLRVTIAVCFDLQFIEQDAAWSLDEVDLLLFPSAWVESPDARPAMLSALARRHGIAIANANWAPGVVRIGGQGSSCIVGADGAPLAVCSRAAPRVVHVPAPVRRIDAALGLSRQSRPPPSG